ncbi:MAG: FAD-dependent oxidoreductase [Deltaproteobacteria bacterium]|nr:MAG: FAD-dependent oxidoreductase [Deltaproteobacteria bacterium]
MEADYEVIIVGCGPAGLAAGLYAARSGLKVLLLGNEAAGGYMRGIEKVENYPGFPDGVSGAKLGLEMMKQAMKYGLQFKLAKVEEIELKNDYKIIKATLIKAGETEEVSYVTKTVIMAGGAHPKKLGVPGENEFAGKGVSYCGVCDAPQFTERVVAVAGGGDAGLTEALYLTRLASEIIIIELMPQLTASKILQDRVFANPKIKTCCGTRVEAITGDDQVRELDLFDVSTSEKTKLPVGGVLVRIGLEPNTSYLEGLLPLDSEGYVLVNEELATSIPGIFAAGDIRHGSARQIATAVGDGVTAALSADRLINLKY